MLTNSAQTRLSENEGAVVAGDSAFVVAVTSRMVTQWPGLSVDRPTVPRGRRIGDWVAGWLDGRRGLPQTCVGDASEGAPQATPRLRRIQHDFDERAALLQRSYARASHESKAKAEQLSHLVATEEWGLERAVVALVEAENARPTVTRRSGEMGIDDSVVLARRSAEQLRLVRSCALEVRRCRQRAGAVRAMLAECEQMIRDLEQDLALAARELSAIYRARIDAYLAGARRSHPEPHELVGEHQGTVEMGLLETALDLGVRQP